MRFVLAAWATFLIWTGSATISGPEAYGQWPQFRGPGARGIADDERVPSTWDADREINIKWKTPIPGLAHSSPIVWGDRVFVTSAVSSDPNPPLRIGITSESGDHPADGAHDFRIYCLDKNSGKIIWEKTAHTGVPQVRRHFKSSHANSTPATDGRHVVACFGSEGLYCYDLTGRPLWKRDLGYLDAGASDKQDQWGFASSPIIHDDKVIVQCDVNNQSFIAAYDIDNGAHKWHVPRDEISTWGTPTVHACNGFTQVIVNGFKHAGGYDVSTGKELWRFATRCSNPIPTPFVVDDLIFMTGCFEGRAALYAIHVNADGNVSLKEEERSNKAVAWSLPKRGSCVPTPIVYGEYLYVVNERGTLATYKAVTGERVYRTRVAGKAEAYSASPVAADGMLFFTSEEGHVHVVRAGPAYEHVATNRMGEPCLATPAISGGMIFVRAQHHLFGIGQ